MTAVSGETGSADRIHHIRGVQTDHRFAWWAWFWPVFVAVLLLDQVSKQWLFSMPILLFHGTAQSPGPVSMSEHWLDRSYNTGVAWGVFAGWPSLVVWMTMVLVPIICVVWWRYYRTMGRVENLAFAAIIGGALGNGIDRFRSMMGGLRGVRDFIRVDLHPVGIDYIWPTFNIADAGISVGFVLLLIVFSVKTKSGSGQTHVQAPV